MGVYGSASISTDRVIEIPSVEYFDKIKLIVYINSIKLSYNEILLIINLCS
jgi:hypothetical protein